MMRAAHFCPNCGAPLESRERFGRVRPVCAACGHTVFFDPKVAVVVFVVAEERVLLVQRANEPGKGGWALPAGFVEHDEPPALAAEREALEETGLQVAAGAVLTVLHRPDPDGLADIVIAYAAQVVGGTPCAGDDAEAVGWFSRDALPPLALATTRLLVEAWGATPP